MGDVYLYRFMDKVRIQDGPIPNSPCWIWTGAKSRGGGMKVWYGSFKYYGKAIRAHAFAADIIRKLDKPEKGFERHHICEDTLCVCPEHLEVVTKAANLQARWENGYEHLDYPPF